MGKFFLHIHQTDQVLLRMLIFTISCVDNVAHFSRSFGRTTKPDLVDLRGLVKL